MFLAFLRTIANQNQECYRYDVTGAQRAHNADYLSADGASGHHKVDHVDIEDAAAVEPERCQLHV